MEPIARDSPSDCAPLSLDWVPPQLEQKAVPTDGDLAVHGPDGALLPRDGGLPRQQSDAHRPFSHGSNRVTVSTMSRNLKGVILRLIAVGIGSEVTSRSLSFSSDLDGLVSDLRICPFSVAA